jgi:hypothetical protein
VPSSAWWSRRSSSGRHWLAQAARTPASMCTSSFGSGLQLPMQRHCRRTRRPHRGRCQGNGPSDWAAVIHKAWDMVVAAARVGISHPPAE